ncbi:MAG: CarD family transcriptional regulator [bacterium]|nr:CarD family transcriptional regulator [bacterium]
MYKVDEIIVYKKEVCKIRKIKEKYLQNKDYYIMSPLEDPSLVINIPVDNTKDIRPVITKEEAESLIAKIPSIELLNSDSKNIETEYKQLLNEDNLENLVKIIKTTYLRNYERTKTKKRISEVDQAYFNKAETRLYNELSISLNLPLEEVKEYIITKLK